MKKKTLHVNENTSAYTRKQNNARIRQKNRMHTKQTPHVDNDNINIITKTKNNAWKKKNSMQKKKKQHTYKETEHVDKTHQHTYKKGQHTAGK